MELELSLRACMVYRLYRGELDCIFELISNTIDLGMDGVASESVVELPCMLDGFSLSSYQTRSIENQMKLPFWSTSHPTTTAKTSL
jgi:hypothetical protein